jgi:uncharacterized protein with ParB-like and HNH nuclease domain
MNTESECMAICGETEWVQKSDDEEEDDYPIDYNIASTPNDFNVNTIVDFITSGIVKIPSFQRNFVWDIKKASKLIESLVMGLPIPQVFFYERAKNDFLVIDGQQRLMTIYYFLKKRFPKIDKRAELRRVFDKDGYIPERIMSDDIYFQKFNLKLSERIVERKNRLEDLNFDTLEESDRLSLGLRTMRCIVIKQFSANDKDKDSAMYEIFYRLNTGGVNLTPQEIRASIYYSNFYAMLSRINLDARWRKLTNAEPDIHMRDLEILLRGFAMLILESEYKPSMLKFLNNFSDKSKKFTPEKVVYLENLFDSFMKQCANLPAKAFWSRSGFSISLYESVFTAVCKEAYSQNNLSVPQIIPERIEELKNDPEFINASQYKTTEKTNVEKKLRRAREIILR